MDNVKNDKYYIEKIIKDLSFILENAGNFTQIQLQNNAQPVQAILPPQGQGVFAPPTSAPTFQPPLPKDDLNG